MRTPVGALFLLLAAATLLGAGFMVGRFFAEPIVEVLPVSGSTATVTVKDGSDAAALAKALSEVAALKAENAALRRAQEEVVEHVQPSAEQPEKPKPRTWREHMEELKKTDPERYKEIMERHEQARQAIREARAVRAEFLDSVDTALLTPEGRETHAQFMDVLAQQAALEEQMNAAFESGETPSEELREAFRDTWQTLREVREKERGVLLGAIATSMGLSGTDAQDFAQLVDDVYNFTTHDGPRRLMRAAPPPQGGNR